MHDTKHCPMWIDWPVLRSQRYFASVYARGSHLFEFVSQFCVVTSCYYRKTPNLRVILADIRNKCPTVAHSDWSRCVRVSSVAIKHLILKAAVLVNGSPDSGRVRNELQARRRNIYLAVPAYGIDVEMTKDRILTKNRHNSVIFGRIRPRIGAFEPARRPAKSRRPPDAAATPITPSVEKSNTCGNQ
jgi:hypothetical protein